MPPSIADIATALQAQLPAELHDCIEPLAAVIAELRAGQLSHAEAQVRLRAEILAPLRAYCARQPLTIRGEGSGALDSGDLIIVGDISQAKGVAIGPYARAEVFELHITIASSSRSVSSTLALARSRHSLERYNELRRGFVGRQEELAQIRAALTEIQPSGGYLLVTGVAGQGKSSVLAALIAALGPATTPAYFIRFSPGADEQVALLRHLVAELLSIHGLDDLTDGLLPETAGSITLANSLAMVLDRLSRESKPVVLVIDGLDQIKPDRQMGERDLAFLPERLPPGVVIVIGTRPDDTLKPLTVLAFQREYKLPPLSAADFAALLAERGAALGADDRQQLYAALHGNAFDLAFVAGEIQRTSDAAIAALLQRVIANPQDIFTPALDRLRADRSFWQRAIRPILGCMLAASEGEPLSEDALGAILSLDTDEVSDALLRLRGFLGETDRDGRVFHYLQHLKLIEYLRGAQRNANGRIFRPRDIEQWHQRLADWCASGQGGLAAIWQHAPEDTLEQERRAYARQHTIVHLAAARAYAQLWTVIDTSTYGRAKRHYDPSARSYVRDLHIARQAAIDAAAGDTTALAHALPRIWQYSLLACSLSSRVDHYPLHIFLTLVDLGRGDEAVNLAELITYAQTKARTLHDIGKAMLNRDGATALTVLRRARAYAQSVHDVKDQARILQTLTETFAAIGQWADARQCTTAIPDESIRCDTLGELALALMRSAQVAEARTTFAAAHTLAESITDPKQRAAAFANVALALAQAGATEEFAETAALARQHPKTSESLAALAHAFASTGRWADAQACIDEMSSYTQAHELSALAVTLAEAGQFDTARSLLATARQITAKMWQHEARSETYPALVTGYIATQQWDEARQCADAIHYDDRKRAHALIALASALARNGKLAEATQTFAAVRSFGENVMYKERRAAILQYLAAALLREGRHAEAAETRQIARRIADQIWEPRQRAQALSQLAHICAQANDRSTAVETLEAARVSAELVADREQIDWTITQLISTLAQLGYTPERAATFAAAKQRADEIEERYHRDDALQALGSAFATAAQWEAARSCAKKVEDITKRVNVLCDLAVALVLAGKADEAEAVFATIYQYIENMQDRNRSDVIGLLTIALARCERWEHVRVWAYDISDTFYKTRVLHTLTMLCAEAKQWSEAKRWVGLIPNGTSRVRALSTLALALAKDGQHEKAHATFAAAQTSYDHLKHSDADERVQALGALALARSEAGHAAEARLNFLQAQQLAETIPITQQRIHAFSTLALSLAQAGRSSEAAHAFATATHDAHQSLAQDTIAFGELRALVASLAQAGQLQASIELLCTLWQRITRRKDLMLLFAIDPALLRTHPQLAQAFLDSFAWVDAQLAAGQVSNSAFARTTSTRSLA